VHENSLIKLFTQFRHIIRNHTIH